MTDKKHLSDAAQAISHDLRKALTFDEKNTANLGNEVYIDHANKAGLTEEGINKVKEYDRTFGAGLMDATAHVALAAIKKAESLKTAKFEVNAKGLTGEEFTASYTGQKSGSITGGDGVEKPWTSHGTVRLAHKSSTHGKRSDLGIVQELAAQAAEAALAGK